jgi:hypothetical protein
MKKIFYILFTLLIFSSCKKWLDVNNSPNSANSAVPTAEQRLPPILYQFVNSYESLGTRVALLCQQLAVTNASNNNWNFTRWNSTASSVAFPWQAWYVNTAVNFTPLIEAAEKVGAYHYEGVAKIIKAWGFGAIADAYGMMPYDQFDDPSTFTPKFDDGSYVQKQILELLDEGIADLGKVQDANAPALSKGDVLNGGNTDTWIRLAHSLKARFMVHLSKKSDFNPQAILDELALGIQTDDQNTIYNYIDQGPTITNASQDALQYGNTGTSARVTKLYVDYITNNYTDAPTGTNNMIDPRLTLLIPSMQDWNGNFILSQGVDMASPLPSTGPKAYSYSTTTNKFSNPDSIYIILRKTPYAPAAGQRIQSTGTWYTQRGSKGVLVTNAEMRFIEAEMKLRQSKLSEALTAYKAGIRSHMTIMGINVSDINNFLNSTSVIKDPAKLTMSHIMIQKYIALSYSPEIFCDLRRMNYCTDASGNYNEATGVYKGFKRPSHVFTDAYPNPTDWPRRLAVASYEINYNIDEVLKADPNASKPTYLNEPVWWDKP